MKSIVKAIAVLGFVAAAGSSMVGCVSTEGHMLQGRAVNGGYDTYRVTLPTDTVVYKDGTTKQFDVPTTYLNQGFKDKCEGAVRLITIKGVDAELRTQQFANYSPAAQADCAK